MEIGTVSYIQITQTLVFRCAQYMENHHRHLFGQLFPMPFCELCPQGTIHIDTWPHLLAMCTHPIIHSLRISTHDQGIWHSTNCFLMDLYIRWWKFVNATIYPSRPFQQTLPPYSCITPTCQYLAKVCLDIILLRSLDPLFRENKTK